MDKKILITIKTKSANIQEVEVHMNLVHSECRSKGYAIKYFNKIFKKIVKDFIELRISNAKSDSIKLLSTIYYGRGEVHHEIFDGEKKVDTLVEILSWE